MTEKVFHRQTKTNLKCAAGPGNCLNRWFVLNLSFTKIKTLITSLVLQYWFSPLFWMRCFRFREWTWWQIFIIFRNQIEPSTQTTRQIKAESNCRGDPKQGDQILFGKITPSHSSHIKKPSTSRVKHLIVLSLTLKRSLFSSF